jgi:3'-phosphoadenosine 5'-phosphosulfate sulfotransferase (PAPS reductase)/FAD synthetase
MMMEKHIVSVSGGKDSTALLILAKLVRGLDVLPIFADTEHEHDETYRYLEYLDKVLGPIQTVKADFSDRIARKRQFIAGDRRTTRQYTKVPVFDAQGNPVWKCLPGTSAIELDKHMKPVQKTRKGCGRKVRWTNKAKYRALSVLQPTGNLFLDMCLWKGRFPSTRRRFCSEQLKHYPIREQIVEPLLLDGHVVVSWQGVRAEESESRKLLPIVDEPEPGLVVYRPLITWTAQDVFDLHREFNIRWNPLYEQGMGRVGCMPCIHATKSELQEISIRWPEVIDWISEMEHVASQASKRGSSTFYDVRVIEKGDTRRVNHRTHGIHKLVEWSKTTRGGHQFDLLASAKDLTMCSSIYGLCERAA